MIDTPFPLSKRTIRPFRRALLILAALSGFADLGAQRAPSTPPPRLPATATDPDEALKIYLVTMGQGDQVYEMFGHNGIWVHDPSAAFDIVYNWGVFDFNAPGFIGRFLLGDMRYMMAGETLENSIAQYKFLNRQMWARELNLTAPEKRALVDFMRWNAMPENRTYRYDYYLDNCSTRVRDALDRVTGGAVRTYLRSIRTLETYRSHSLRLMQGAPLTVTGVQMALGRPTDVQLSADQASFLPVQLVQHLEGLKLDGGARPLLGEQFVLNGATREPEATAPPRLWKGLIPAGLLLAAIVFGLAMTWKPRALAAMIAVIAGLTGVVGLILTLLVTVTDHVAAHANENLFLLNPLWLAIAIIGPMWILRRRAAMPARWLAFVVSGLAICAVLIHAVGLSRQPNWDIIALLLPVQLTIAWVLLRKRSA